MTLMSEDDLLIAVIDLVHLFGGKVAHFRPAQIRPGKWVTAVQGDGKGAPDCCPIVGPGGVLFRELKADKGRLSPQQKEWLDLLREAGADVGVWWPADLRSGRVEQEIRAVCKPRKPRKVL